MAGVPSVPGYNVLTRVADGGSATIYKAERYPHHEVCALKVLLPRWVGDSDMEAAFRNEVEVAGEIRHPHVIRVRRLVADAERPTAELEWFPGEPLKVRVAKEGPLAPGPAASVGRQVAEALEAVHEAGYLHKDLKPENVLVRDDGDGLDVRLIDFSIARPIRRGFFARLFGGKEKIQGTLSYISPEALKQEDLGPEADLWSLGTVIYEALTGDPPFKATDESALLRNIVGKPHPSLGRARDDVPGALADLVDRLLTKDPADRPGSAAEVARELAALE